MLKLHLFDLKIYKVLNMKSNRKVNFSHFLIRSYWSFSTIL